MTGYAVQPTLSGQALDILRGCQFVGNIIPPNPAVQGSQWSLVVTDPLRIGLFDTKEEVLAYLNRSERQEAT